MSEKALKAFLWFQPVNMLVCTMQTSTQNTLGVERSTPAALAVPIRSFGDFHALSTVLQRAFIILCHVKNVLQRNHFIEAAFKINR